MVDQKQGCATFRVQKFGPSTWAVSYSLALGVVTADSTCYYRWQVKRTPAPLLYCICPPTPTPCRQCFLKITSYPHLAPCLSCTSFLGGVFSYVFYSSKSYIWIDFFFFVMPTGVVWGSEISGSTLHTFQFTLLALLVVAFVFLSSVLCCCFLIYHIVMLSICCDPRIRACMPPPVLPFTSPVVKMTDPSYCCLHDCEAKCLLKCLFAIWVARVCVCVCT